MNAVIYPVAPPVLPLQQATQRLWCIRHLLRERAIDPLAADTALRPLRDHPHPRVAGLAGQTTAQLVTRVMGPEPGR